MRLGPLSPWALFASLGSRVRPLGVTATDAEKQPFSSMDFVSVIIVSALFALGLPLVLL